VNADAAFKARNRIGAVNSINWARVAAQVVYYFKGYFASGADEVSFAVPSGNFGNVYAGYVARQMGLPIRRLIVATNENTVLDEFFRTGRYRIRRKVKETTSPSMDISKASNFERYVFDLVGRDGARVKELWRRLDADGEFDLSRSAFWRHVPQTGFVSGRSTHADRLSTIRSVYEKYRLMIDPHTADGVKVGLEHREPLVPLICLETALPVKFADTLRAALGREPERPAELAGLEKLPQRFKVLPNDVGALKRYIESAA
jgi:threonine synthase